MMKTKKEIIEIWKPKIIKNSKYWDNSKLLLESMNTCLINYEIFQFKYFSYYKDIIVMKEFEKQNKNFGILTNKNMANDLRIMWKFVNYLKDNYFKNDVENDLYWKHQLKKHKNYKKEYGKIFSTEPMKEEIKKHGN